MQKFVCIDSFYIQGFNMFAVVKTGGKQYRLSVGEKLKIEQIAAEPGQVVALAEVLAVGSGETITLGTPVVAGAAVHATVLSHGRADKVRIFKMRRRKHYQKRQGHRQWFTEIFISEIAFGGQSATASAPSIAAFAAIPAATSTANTAPVANAAPAKKAAKAKVGDDLTLIEGIGPKIAGLFNDAGITTFAQLADTSVDKMKEILHAAGPRFQMHNPGTWAEQGAMARDGKMDELKAWQDAHIAGKA
jgi:large subunit ribosomal protein L21